MSKELRSSKNLQVIINPAAGVGRPILQALNSGLKDTGIEWDVNITHKAGDAERLAREAVENGADLVGVQAAMAALWKSHLPCAAHLRPWQFSLAAPPM